MGCCCKEEKVGVPGVVRSRCCSDFLVFLLFGVGWAALIVLLMYAQRDGASFDRITMGYDMNAVQCGTGVNANKPYAAWPHPLAFDSKICVATCDETATLFNPNMAVNYATLRVAGWCLPDPTDAATTSIGISSYSSSYASASEAAQRSASDLWVLRWVLLVSVGAAIFLSLIVMVLSRNCVSFFVWSTIMLFIGAGCVLGGIFWFRYRDGTDAVQSQWTQAWFALALGTWGVTFICALVAFFLRKQIKIAIEVVREASRTIGAMPCMLLFPVVPAVAVAGYFVLFVLSVLWLNSVGTFVTHPTSSLVLTYAAPNANSGRIGGSTGNPANSLVFETNSSYQYFCIYLVFHLLWCSQTVVYLGYLTMAGAVANWYFAVREFDGSKRRGGGEDELPSFPILRSLYRAVCCNIGTAAFAALIMAIIRILRLVVFYVRSKLAGKANAPARFVLCLCACCLACLDCCMDKVSKNALIWTAIFGDSFCTSVCSSFTLVLSHLAKVAAINGVSTYIIFLCKLTVAFSATAGAGIFIQYYKDLKYQITSITVPLIVLFLGTYIVASICMQVFSTTIDTVFFCFLVDLDYNQASGAPMRASDELIAIVDGYSEQSKEAFEKQGYGKSTSSGNLARVAPMPANADTDGGAGAGHGERGQDD